MTSTQEPNHRAGNSSGQGTAEPPATAQGTAEPPAARPGARRALLLGLVGVLLFAGVVAYAAYQLKHINPPAPAGAGSASGVPVGRDGAPAIVDIYEDLSCPACRTFTLQVESALDTLIGNGSTRVVYHPVAFLDSESTTRYSSRAAAAAGCAAEAGTFRRYLMLLYVNQPAPNGPGLSNAQLIELGRQVGATTRFADCVIADTYGRWVSSLTDAAHQAGVTGLPTVLVNGRRVEPTRAALLQAVQGTR